MTPREPGLPGRVPSRLGPTQGRTEWSENNIKGQASYRWLPGGFFLEQSIRLDFMGMEIDSLELIGYDPETKTFPSTVYSNLSPSPCRPGGRLTRTP
ncbi:MAG: DUF1579 family protein [Actinomycetota bacterium]